MKTNSKRKVFGDAVDLLIKKKCYKVPARIVEKYFEGMDPNKVDSIVEHALEAWFSKEDANVRTEEP